MKTKKDVDVIDMVDWGCVDEILSGACSRVEIPENAITNEKIAKRYNCSLDSASKKKLKLFKTGKFERVNFSTGKGGSYYLVPKGE